MTALAELHLFLPGLAARLAEWRRSYGWEPQAAGLQRLLAGARHERMREPLLHVAAGLLGVAGSIAGFRRLGQGLPAAPAALCADPVHLRTGVDSALLVEAHHLDLQADETQRLYAQVQDWFGGDGWRFEQAGAACGYALPPPHMQVPAWPAPADIAGRDVGPCLRAPGQSPQWKRFHAELQMLLAGSEINRLRQARGAPTVDALWFWGGGSVGRARVPAGGAVQGESPVLRGMGRAAGLAVSPPRLENALREGGLVWLDQLHDAAAYDDIEAWRQSLRVLDEAWFQPLAQAVAARRLAAVHLYAEGCHWEARRLFAWRRWRKPAPLLQILAPEAGA